MRIRTVLAGAACAPVLMIAGVAPASAGEVTGPWKDGFATGKPTGIWGHANSECSFSGLNAKHPGKPAAHAQSYGQGVRAGLKGTEDWPSPGIACNGHTAGMK